MKVSLIKRYFCAANLRNISKKVFLMAAFFRGRMWGGEENVDGAGAYVADIQNGIYGANFVANGIKMASAPAVLLTGGRYFSPEGSERGEYHGVGTVYHRCVDGGEVDARGGF